MFNAAPHGTINRYNNQKCRCDKCRAAMRDYRRTQRAQHKRSQYIARTAFISATPPARPTPTTPHIVPTIRCQVVHASCGHLLWFPAKITIPLGGWVRCPQHLFAGVRDIHPAATIPTDALRGSPLDL